MPYKFVNDGGDNHDIDYCGDSKMYEDIQQCSRLLNRSELANNFN